MRRWSTCTTHYLETHLEDGLEEIRIVHDLAVVRLLVIHVHALPLHQHKQYMLVVNNFLPINRKNRKKYSQYHGRQAIGKSFFRLTNPTVYFNIIYFLTYSSMTFRELKFTCPFALIIDHSAVNFDFPHACTIIYFSLQNYRYNLRDKTYRNHNSR